MLTLTAPGVAAGLVRDLIWAYRKGFIDGLPFLAPGELLVAIALLDRRPLPVRGP